MSADKTKYLKIIKEVIENQKEISKIQAKNDKLLEELRNELSPQEVNLLRQVAVEAVDSDLMDEQYDSLEEALDSIEGEEGKHYIAFGLQTATSFHSPSARVLRIPESELEQVKHTLMDFHNNKRLTEQQYRMLRGNYIIPEYTYTNMNMVGGFLNIIRTSFNHTGMKLFVETTSGGIQSILVPYIG